MKIVVDYIPKHPDECCYACKSQGEWKCFWENHHCGCSTPCYSYSEEDGEEYYDCPFFIGLSEILKKL